MNLAHGELARRERFRYDADALFWFDELSIIGMGERRELDDLIRYLKSIDQWEDLKALLLDRVAARLA